MNTAIANGKPASKAQWPTPKSSIPKNGAADDRYTREDWTLFRVVRTISQLSGVPPSRLRRLVAKELTDNALDAAGAAKVGELPNGGFYVEDDGPGISGTPEEIARLFSFKRPLISSKMKRLPIRGALGNGNRVVAGAVFASEGSLRVLTNGRALDLYPQESGETLVRVKRCKRRTGTRVEVRLGNAIPEDLGVLEWAEFAIDAAGQKPIYSGKVSPWWYDSDSAFEFFKAAGSRPVQAVMQQFDGYSKYAGEVVKRFSSREAASLNYQETEGLIKLARSHCQPIRPERLALVGSGLKGYYAKERGTVTLEPGRGSLAAELPYTVEAWCSRSYGDEDYIVVLVNRSPVTGEVSIQRAREKADVNVFGCNLGHRFTVGRKSVRLMINVQIPYMPITSNGKEPDLELFVSSISNAVERAARKCKQADPASEDRMFGFLPSLPKGRPSDEAKEKYAAELKQFAKRLKEMKSTVDFTVSSRGWCYILENEHALPKGDFSKAQRLINDCRKEGLLPIDFTAEDEARGADNLETSDSDDPMQHALAIASALHQWDDYSPGSFWDNQPVYIQMVVEKIDIKHLFLPVCHEYHVPIVNARGWSDLNLRAALMRRFQEHESKGQIPVLLSFGDHDPHGLLITKLLLKHMRELERGVGWSPRNLVIERFGLNADFIKQHNLTWIDGLQTGSGMDLGDKDHRQHKAEFVQQYIAKFGKRKVEANALVVRPDAGRQLCREAIEKHLDMGAIDDYEQSLIKKRQQVKAALPSAAKQILKELGERTG